MHQISTIRARKNKKHAVAPSDLTEGLCATREEALDALRYLMRQFDGETWQCEQCGHAEDTATMDSAIWLREWMKAHNVIYTPEKSPDKAP